MLFPVFITFAMRGTTSQSTFGSTCKNQRSILCKEQQKRCLWDSLLHDDTDVDGRLRDAPMRDAHFLDETVVLV